MIIRIQTRDDRGKFLNATPGEFAAAAIGEVLNIGGDWRWFRDWLCRVCLRRAETCSTDRIKADQWIARYQAIRGIE